MSHAEASTVAIPPELGGGPEEELAYRLVQQKILADFGLFALRCPSFDLMLEAATKLCGQGLATRFCKALEYRADENSFLVRAGTGWEPGVVGFATIGADLESPAGYAYKTGRPVISNHLGGETRFRTPQLLIDHGIKRAINVVIASGPDTPAFGVLEADSAMEGRFEEADLAFMQGFANLLAVGIERHRADRQRDESQELLRAIVETVPVGLVIAEAPGGRILHGNPQAERIFRHPILPSPDIAAYTDWVAFHPDGRPVAAEEYPLARALAQGETTAPTEFLYQRGDGTQGWVQLQAAPIRDKMGAVVAGVVAVVDIDGHKRSEEQQRLLTHELEHRVKNTLAMVQAISHQTLRGAVSLEAAQTAFSDRLVALGRAHDLLTQTSWTAAPITTVVESSLAPHNISGRIDATGPEIRLGAAAALALALALHELATNATKYGALSNEAGRVSVTWAVVDGADGPALHFRWAEHGGPPVAAPAHRGFGSRLIERSLGAEISATVSIDYHPAGVVCTVEAPLAKLLQAKDSAFVAGA